MTAYIPVYRKHRRGVRWHEGDCCVGFRPLRKPRLADLQGRTMCYTGPKWRGWANASMAEPPPYWLGVLILLVMALALLALIVGLTVALRASRF